jgi:protein gp37
MEIKTMAQNTAIQWCDSTENPTMGCAGCELWNEQRQICYAGVLHRRFAGVSSGYAPHFEQVTMFPGRMKRATRWSDLTGKERPQKPWLNGMPRLIFVSDMSDALSATVQFEYLLEEIIQNVRTELGRRHRWLWLTKRPQRMAEFSRWLDIEWPSNLWVATSITTQRSTSRIKHLLRVGDGKTTRFLSVEPQWEEINLDNWLPKINWVIQGGESGPNAHDFHVEWADSLVRQCKTHRVPFFLKQLGSNVCWKREQAAFQHSHGGNWDEWPTRLRVRKFPAFDAAW